MHNTFNGNLLNGGDIAVITLAQDAPVQATRFDIYRGGSEVGETIEKSGYGRTGTGFTGSTLASGAKRDGLNRVDVLGEPLNGTVCLLVGGRFWIASAVPVAGIDTISIGFGEHVLNVSGGSLMVRGLTTTATPTLASVGGFTYDVGTHVATWKFSVPLAADQYLLTLADTVTDVVGKALDEEWTNPFSVDTSKRS